jgi:hypothetical protein
VKEKETKKKGPLLESGLVLCVFFRGFKFSVWKSKKKKKKSASSKPLRKTLLSSTELGCLTALIQGEPDLHS